MVFYTCSGCGESLKKNKVEKHFHICRSCEYVTCIDCSKDFWGNDYQSHTSCISELEKYSASGFQAKPCKGEVKQQKWLKQIEKALMECSNLSNQARTLLESLKDHDNIPRKKGKFMSFLKSCLRVRNMKLAEEIWDAIQSVKTEDENTKKVADEPLNKEVENSENCEKKKKTKKSKPAAAEEEVVTEETSKIEMNGCEEEKVKKEKKKKKKKENTEEAETAKMENETSISKKKKRKLKEMEEETHEKKKVKLEKEDAVNKSQNDVEMAEQTDNGLDGQVVENSENVEKIKKKKKSKKSKPAEVEVAAEEISKTDEKKVKKKKKKVVEKTDEAVVENLEMDTSNIEVEEHKVSKKKQRKSKEMEEETHDKKKVKQEKEETEHKSQNDIESEDHASKKKKVKLEKEEKCEGNKLNTTNETKDTLQKKIVKKEETNKVKDSGGAGLTLNLAGIYQKPSMLNRIAPKRYHWFQAFTECFRSHDNQQEIPLAKLRKESIQMYIDYENKKSPHLEGNLPITDRKLEDIFTLKLKKSMRLRVVGDKVICKNIEDE